MTVAGNDGTGFADHFSGHSERYARFRPQYPDQLFDAVAQLVDRRDVAWDCGCGSGQASVPLAARFQHVIATDASAKQIAQAQPADRVEYRVAPAEDSGLAGASVDLCTVAQAVHWFDLPRFYAEVRRVLAPGGAIAIWTYADAIVDEDRLDAAVRRFARETVEDYWPPERRYVWDGYRSLAFPFDEVAMPAIEIEREWSRAEMIGYIGTWSSVARFREATGSDPLPALDAELASAGWGDQPRRVRWPLTVRAGK